MSSLQQTGRFLPFANSNIQRKQLSSQGNFHNLIVYVKNFREYYVETILKLR